jgi:hypothetical protein
VLIYSLIVGGISMGDIITSISTARFKGILKIIFIYYLTTFLSLGQYISCIINSVNNVSKLGSEIIRNGGGLTPTMEMGVMNANPIWYMLNITEEQYQLEYEFKAFQKNEEAINELVKEAFDASLGFIKDETKEETK